MAHDIIALIAQYDLLMVFLSVLVDQAGVPLPAMPRHSLWRVPWRRVGSYRSPVSWWSRWLAACSAIHFGAAVMRTLCRISLSSDSTRPKFRDCYDLNGGRLIANRSRTVNVRS
jgi:hypothetical protein